MKKELVHNTEKLINKSKKHLDSVLDEALEESFPASDPVAVDVSRVVEQSARERKKTPKSKG